MTQNYVLRRKGMGDGMLDVPEFTKTGLVLFDNKEVLPEADYVFRWGTTSNLPGKPKVVNTAAAIHKVYDKRTFRMELGDLAPKSWPSLSSYLKYISPENEEPYPVLIRKNNHARSEDMYISESLGEIADICERLGKDNYYISELIQKTHEYRVMFVSGRVIGVIEKFPKDKNEISWGCVDAGNYSYINWEDWPMDVVRLALKAADLSGLDFGAIDVISDENRSYVLEINSAPWLSPYFCRIFTEAFDYIVQNGKDQIKVKETQDFKGYIHPSRYAGAKL